MRSQRRLVRPNIQEEGLPLVRHYAFEETSGTQFFDVNGVNKLTLYAGNISTLTTTDSISGNAIKFTSQGTYPGENYSSDFTFRDGNGNKPFDIEYYVKDLIGSSFRSFVQLREGGSNYVVHCYVYQNVFRFYIYKQDGTHFGILATYPVNYSGYSKYLFRYVPGIQPQIIIDGIIQVPTGVIGTEGNIKITTPKLWIGGLEREGYMDEFKLRIG